eukprot:1026497-Amorphochlora_amoeboformis.AAC.4
MAGALDPNQPCVSRSWIDNFVDPASVSDHAHACRCMLHRSLQESSVKSTKGFRLWQAEHKRMDLDFMDTMEPIDPVAIVSCGTRGGYDTILSSIQIARLTPDFRLHT